MSPEKNCFELYGFDVMIDDLFKPWLIEVNGSPSMRGNTKEDKQLKIGLVDDVLTIVDL
jgi:tubulin polyglutamylase TTLL9